MLKPVQFQSSLLTMANPTQQFEEHDVMVFAETRFRNRRERFGIRRKDRRYHMHILGKTGMGKTTLLENMILSDIYTGEGVCVIEPHGDLINNLLERIPSYRVNDVIYFNPSDQASPTPLNILRDTNSGPQSVIVSGVLDLFRMLFGNAWGVKMEHIFRHALLSAMHIPGATLFTVSRLLTDAPYREKWARRLPDTALKEFWEREFAGFDKRQRTEAVSPILNKIGQFKADPLMRVIIGGRKNTIDFRKSIDSRKIILANLSKGSIGSDNMRLFGALLVSKLQVAALSQTNIPEERRTDMYLYIDECQNFVTDTLASMLAEMRKFRLNLILANQHLGQFIDAPMVQTSILGNVGSLICFRIGSPDAQLLAGEFFPNIQKEDLVRLGKYQIYLKLMINGATSDGFNAATLPPHFRKAGNTARIVQQSRQRYATHV